MFAFDDGIEDGAVRWSSGFDARTELFYRVAVGDVDGNGFLDVVVSADGRLHVLDGRDGIARSGPLLGTTGAHGNLFLGDLDGDQDDEIVFLGLGERGLWTFDVRERFGPDDPEGVTVRAVHPTDEVPNTIEDALADLDGDGIPELAYYARSRLFVRDPLSGDIKLEIVGGAPRAVADFDADGIDDLLVFAKPPWRLLVAGVSARGEPLRVKAERAGIGFGTFNHGRTGDTNVRSDRDRRMPPAGAALATSMLTAATSDLDGDGRAEIITWDLNARRIRVVEMEGEELASRWHSEVAGDAYAFAPVHGVGRLGDDERFVLFASSDGEIHALDGAGGRLWARAGAGRLGDPLVGDLDGDDLNELVVQAASVRSKRRAWHGPIRVLDASEADADNAPAERPFSFDGAVDNLHNMHLVLAPLDDAPGLEVFTSNRDFHVAAYDAAGEQIWESQQQRRTVRDIGTAHLHGHEVATPVIRLADRRYVSLSPETGENLHAAFPGYTSVPSAVDANHDGLDDLVATNLSALLVLDGELMPRDSGLVGGPAAGGSVIPADCDGDGDDEVFTTGYDVVLCAETTGAVRWSTAVGASVRDHRGAAGDLDADGADDLVQSSNVDVVAWNGTNGDEMWRYARPDHVAFSHVTLNDVDGDGSLEVVVTSLDGWLLALDGSTGEVEWSVELHGQPGSPVVADVDGDGHVEVLLAVSGELRAYGPGGEVVGPEVEPCVPAADNEVACNGIDDNCDGRVDERTSAPAIIQDVDGRLELAWTGADFLVVGGSVFRFDANGERLGDPEFDAAFTPNLLRIAHSGAGIGVATDNPGEHVEMLDLEGELLDVGISCREAGVAGDHDLAWGEDRFAFTWFDREHGMRLGFWDPAGSLPAQANPGAPLCQTRDEEVAHGSSGIAPDWRGGAPAIAWDGETFGIATLSANRGAPGGTVQFARFDPSGAQALAWMDLGIDPVDPNWTGVYDGYQSTMLWDGEAYALATYADVGIEGVGQRTSVQVVRFDREGALLSRATVADGLEAGFGQVSLVQTGDGFAVAWHYRGDIWLATLDASGELRGEPVRTAARRVTRGPSLAWTGEGLALAWAEGGQLRVEVEGVCD